MYIWPTYLVSFNSELLRVNTSTLIRVFMFANKKYFRFFLRILPVVFLVCLGICIPWNINATDTMWIKKPKNDSWDYENIAMFCQFQIP